MLVKIDGRDLRYDILGDEDAPVVCMAHCLSFDSGVWAEQVPPLLAAGWRVLRLDMRGHGGSDAGPDDCTMSMLAQDVAEVLDFLGIAKVHFVGVSIGGMIGQVFGIEHADRALSLMLCGTAPAALEGGMELLWAPRFEAIAAAGSLEPLADATMTRWVTKVGAFIRMSGGNGPDGVAMDEDDNIAVCHVGMGCVWLFDRIGEPLLRIRAPGGLKVTNCAYGGAGGKSLFITEAGTGAILRADMPVAGRTLHLRAA